MGEKICEEQITDLLATLKSDSKTLEVKVQGVNNAKSSIKQNNVPDACIAPLFDMARMAMSSSHTSLVSAGFSTLGHLLTRISRQDPRYLVREAARTLPLLIDRTGDSKEKYRTLAAQCLSTLWKAAPMDVERAVRNTGLVGKNSRAKETCMHWLLDMHENEGLQFRGFVPVLMELLEDADGMVRDSARSTVLGLFQNAPNAAKSDLKKQLKNFNVRPAIANAITNHLIQGVHSEAEQPAAESPKAMAQASRNVFAESVSSQVSAVPVPSFVPEAKVDAVQPLYINTQRELEDAFRDMHPFFEGKESEQNWLKREQSCTKLRRINAGNAPSDFREAYLLGLKALLDGILKAVNSLRTSLSKEGCSLVQEAARTAGPGLDPMVEILLQNLIKLCGGTKKISSQNGNITVDIIVGKVSYTARIMQHIWLACQDKNVQPRTYATGWLKTLINKEAHHKNHVEHSGGLDLIEKCVKKGLADANPGVRESMRGTYWTFAKVWPAKAEAIMASLDAVQQNKLQQDASNPRKPVKEELSSVKPGMGFSKSTNVPPKPSLRETMLAQRKAAAASKNLPSRPGSAMSSLASPAHPRSVSSTSGPNGAPKVSRPENGSMSRRPDTSSTTSVSHGGLSVAPMRPPKPRVRPEMSRPATAGPYSVRRPAHAPGSDPTNNSPTLTRSKTTVMTATGAVHSTKKMIPRPGTSQSTHSTHSSVSHTSPNRNTATKPPVPKSPGRNAHTKSTLSRRTSPKAHTVAPPSSLRKNDEELTMVIPAISSLSSVADKALPKSNGEVKSEISTSTPTLKVYEDPSDDGNETIPRPSFSSPVLEELAVNEDAALLNRNGVSTTATRSPTAEHCQQTLKLLDSGIGRIQSKSLDVHSFRKLQALLRDKQSVLDHGRFQSLLLGLFDYLEAPLAEVSPEKVQDIKAQVLVTINLMLKKDREAFRAHVPRGLRSLLATRSRYDARAHIVNGLLLLADELVALADAADTTAALLATLEKEAPTTPEGRRTLGIGLHILKALLLLADHAPTEAAVGAMARLALRCLESSESSVRQDAVLLCVALHSRIGEPAFWEVMGGVMPGPKCLITYYIVKKQREASAA